MTFITQIWYLVCHITAAIGTYTLIYLCHNVYHFVRNIADSKYNSVYPLWTIPQISIIRLQYLVCSTCICIRAAIGISIINTCVYPFVRDKVRLELGGESTLVTQVRTVTAVGHYVLLHRVLGGERTLTNVTLKRSKPYTYEIIKINNS